ncbi:MAG: hypothetical protein J6032_00170, partial [Bacteroidales bacterium]|nr:hypothetical protein [Bacteroidales bacterium]
MKHRMFRWMWAVSLMTAGILLSGCNPKDDGVSPTADSSQFVTLAEAVPDAILEIRYYGTYNFCGCPHRRLPAAHSLTDPRGGRQSQGSQQRCDGSGLP